MWNLIGQFAIFPDFSIIKCITDIDGSSKSRKSRLKTIRFPKVTTQKTISRYHTTHFPRLFLKHQTL